MTDISLQAQIKAVDNAAIFFRSPYGAANGEHLRAAAATLRQVQDHDELAWVVERYMNSALEYFEGRGPDTWTNKHQDAMRFAREEDASRVIAWLCNGCGRAAQHMWISKDQPASTPDVPAATAGPQAGASEAGSDAGPPPDALVAEIDRWFDRGTGDPEYGSALSRSYFGKLLKRARDRIVEQDQRIAELEAAFRDTFDGT